MITVILNHKVRDFNEWLPIFEDHAAVRAQYGFSNAQVLRNAEDPNNITVICECADERSFTEYLDKSNMRESMVKSGVIGLPAFTIHESAGIYPA